MIETIVCSIIYVLIRAGTIITRIKNKENSKNILTIELTASILTLFITTMIIMLSTEYKWLDNVTFEMLTTGATIFDVIWLCKIAKINKRIRSGSGNTIYYSTAYYSSTYYKETKQAEKAVHNDKGNEGEYRISLELDKPEGYSKTVFNVNLPNGQRDTEADIIYINSSGLYVIESKNYSGRIYGHAENNQWTRTLITANGTEMYKFYNPIWQNENHVNAVKRLLSKYEDLPIYSLVVFSDNATITTDIESENVINTKDVTAKIKTEQLLTESAIDEIYRILRSHSCWAAPGDAGN